MYSLANAYGKRPSEIMQLETELGAWQLDEACLMVGRRVENNIGNNKDAFEGLDTPRTEPRRYQSAKARARKKVKIKPNGTW